MVAKLPCGARPAIYDDSNIRRSGSFNPKLYNSVMKSRVDHVAINSAENCIIFTTQNQQIMRVNVNLDRKCEEAHYDYHIFPFHSDYINGLDVALKRQYVVTCAHDNTVRLWNYATKTLEICEVFMDEPMSVAFHPSGYQLVVGFVDRVRMMNVFARNLKSYHEISIKACREIKFSNGGHLFACANQYTLNVYNFYTAECPSEFVFKEHQGKIKCIQWLDDDSGLISAGLDGTIFVWKLHLEYANIVKADR